MTSRAALLLVGAFGCAAASSPPSRVTEAENRFDPSKVAVGDTVAGLKIRRIDARAIPGEEGEWVGTVDFAGEATLRGTYRPHHDAPEPNLVCFHPDAASAARLPRFVNDERNSWFCFTNQREAAMWLGPPPATGEATVTIDAFHYNYSRSDVFNGARLVRADLSLGR